MRLQVIGSSSSGNCYILYTDTGALMLECGLPFSKIKKAIDFDLSKIVACVVTHSHKDHCKSAVDVMAAGIDTYMSKGTSDALGISGYRLKEATNQEPILLPDFYILPFETQHDCEGSLGFLIIYIPTGEQIVFATDTYYIKYNFKNINYLLLECNYIPEILEENVEAGKIHPAMKDRIISSHFSLPNVLEFIKATDMSTVKNIVLLHLSSQNSDADRMIKEVQEQSQRKVVVATPGITIDLVKAPF